MKDFIAVKNTRKITGDLIKTVALIKKIGEKLKIGGSALKKMIDQVVRVDILKNIPGVVTN